MHALRHTLAAFAAILLTLPAAAGAHEGTPVSLLSADTGLTRDASLAAAAAGAPLYPDLRTLPPRDLRFDVTDTPNGPARNVLRFTNTAWNGGEGPLEIGGDVPRGSTTAPAIQSVVHDDGTRTQAGVGNYTIHPEHQHFHYDGWGRYELWTKAAFDNWIAAGRPASVQPDLVGSKTTSCVLDEEFIASLASTPWPRVYPDGGCDPTTSGKIASGLSVGWGDTYDYDRYEQWIDLGSRTLADGDYVLRSVADPENKVYESPGKADPSRESQEANEAMTTLRISGGKIADVDRPSGTVTINDVAARTNTTNVTVRVLGRDDVSGVAAARVSNDGVTWRTYTPYGGSGSVPMSVAWDLADTRYGGATTQGERTVYAQFQDRSGKWSPSQTDTIQLGSGAPTGGSNSLYRTAVMGDSPLAYWRLGETTGSTAIDETGRFQAGYSTGATRGVAGLLNSDVDRAARLASASSGSVDVPEAPGLALPGNFALEAWVRPDALPAAGSFASILTRPEAYSLQLNGPRLELTIMQNGARRRLQAPAGAVAAGSVYHVVGTYDGAQVRLYLNGAQVASMALSGGAGAGQEGVHIGSWEGYNEFFDGTVDEAAIYGSLLTGLQVKQHYDAGISTAVGVSTPTDLKATPASTSRIDLAWTDTANNETGVVVERATSSAFASPVSKPLPAGATSFADTGLTAGTTYWYRVKSVTATDSSAWSNVVSAATQSTTPPPPAAPTSPAATPVSAGQVDVRWTDASSDETGFELERGTTSGFTSPIRFTLAAGATSRSDTGLTASTTYWYRVRSVRGTAVSAWSPAVSATTQATTTPPPAGYAASVAADAPVSHWRLGETTGAAAADVRAANPGTYRNAIALGATSLLAGDQANRAVRADGTNDWVQVADSASLDLTSAITLEAWIRPEALPAAGGFASIVTKAESYSLQFNGRRLEFTVMQNGGRRRLQAADGAVVAGRAYHVVGTYDGVTQRLYLNGALTASRAQTGAATVGTWPLSLGSWNGSGEYLKGTLDDVAVFAKTLSAARVKAHYDAAGGAAGTATAASRSRAGTSRAPKVARDILGPAQQLTVGLNGPGVAARRRACAAAAAPSSRTKLARERKQTAQRACRSLRREALR